MTRTAAIDYSEALISTDPVTVRRRVKWGECDPAQVVYTPRFLDYTAAAFGWFMRTVLDDVTPGLSAAGIGTPAKAVSLEFHRMLRPDDWFDMTVKVAEVRTRTFDLEIRAHTLGGELAFVGRTTPIMFENATQRSVAIPAEIRDALCAYRDQWPTQPTTRLT